MIGRTAAFRRLGALVTLAVLMSLAACGDRPSSPVSPGPVDPGPAPLDLGDVIEALFLGSGPLRPRDGFVACSDQGVWTGFRRGTTVRVIVSTAAPTAAIDAVRAAAAQVSLATNGAITATFETTTDPDPRPVTNEVTATLHPSPTSQGCVTDIGCTIHTFAGRGILAASRALLPASQTPNAYSHDAIGHGILGMCHIDGALIGGPANSMMSGGPGVNSGQIALRLTDLDIQALQAVYGSSLNPGAGRAEFVAAGLINP